MVHVPDNAHDVPVSKASASRIITKTRLFKYIENFSSKN